VEDLMPELNDPDLMALLAKGKTPSQPAKPKVTPEPATPEDEADRLEGLSRPNVKSGRLSLDRLDADVWDLDEAESALEDFEALSPSDFPGDAEGYQDERFNAWNDFVEALRNAERQDEDPFEDEE
jgi:hypothetical protein